MTIARYVGQVHVERCDGMVIFVTLDDERFAVPPRVLRELVSQGVLALRAVNATKAEIITFPIVARRRRKSPQVKPL